MYTESIDPETGETYKICCPGINPKAFISAMVCILFLAYTGMVVSLTMLMHIIFYECPEKKFLLTRDT